MAQTPVAQLDRNKAVALRFKKAQGTKEEQDVMREVLSPNYKRLRGGMHHLAANAEPGIPRQRLLPARLVPGSRRRDRRGHRGRRPGRAALPVERDAQGHSVRHSAHREKGGRLRSRDAAVSMYGIPPTGKVVEVAEIGTARFADGKWAQSWYFGDELGLILQLGLSPDMLVT